MNLKFMGRRVPPPSRGAGPAKASGLLGKILQAFSLISVLSLALASGSPRAAGFEGKVVGVVDGDTLDILLTGRTRLRVRLAEIDAPEKDQPWGQRSKRGLSALVFSKPVHIESAGVDRYGRTIARVYLGSLDVNRKMVEDGLAWAYRAYLTDPRIDGAERQARANKVGLWSATPSEINPPWRWRHGGSMQISKPIMRSTTADFQCGLKHYCRQMISCDEAKFYNQRCGVRSLDGDNDGTPCEALCR